MRLDAPEKARALPWYETGQNPDYRFSLANERTFLAWIRTALAMLAGAVVLHQVAEHLSLGREARFAALSLAVLATALSGLSYRRWRDNEIAMRFGRGLPRPNMLAAIAVVLTAFSIATAIQVLR